MENSFGIDGNSVENYVIEQVNIFAENLEVEILPTVMNKSVTYIKNTAGAVGFLIVTIIAVFLILKDYDKILSCIKRNEDFKGILEILRTIHPKSLKQMSITPQEKISSRYISTE